jgi:uncharacterized membrane protein YfcA
MSLSTALIAVAIGIGTGVVSGMLGVGGGILMVPGMVLFLGMTQHTAEGTSLLVIIPTALVGAYTHFRKGYVLLLAAAILGAGGIAGAFIGSRIALSVPAHTLRVIFGVYLVLLGVRMVIPARQREQPASP